MGALAVVGTQWGDEGKGKIVDLLARDADMVVRYQGGSNAGHTVVKGGATSVFHLVPWGILYRGTTCVIGNGVVVHPPAPIEELDGLRRNGLRTERNLFVSQAAHDNMPYHHWIGPYVTSSSASAGGACTGVGIGPTAIDGVLGIAKAYTTRVGSGPFPTELSNEVGAMLQKQGNEFGSTTGRARRCGWYDAVLVRCAVRVNGLTSLAITKLDVLDHLDEIRICTGYTFKGRRLDEIPQEMAVLSACNPIYEIWPGWKRSTTGITAYRALPVEARRYMARLEELAGCPIDLVSTGSKREQTIVLRNPLLRSRRRSGARPGA